MRFYLRAGTGAGFGRAVWKGNTSTVGRGVVARWYGLVRDNGDMGMVRAA